jgi:hypothetical protein
MRCVGTAFCIHMPLAGRFDMKCERHTVAFDCKKAALAFLKTRLLWAR